MYYYDNERRWLISGWNHSLFNQNAHIFFVCAS